MVDTEGSTGPASIQKRRAVSVSFLFSNGAGRFFAFPVFLPPGLLPAVFLPPRFSVLLFESQFSAPRAQNPHQQSMTAHYPAGKQNESGIISRPRRLPSGQYLPKLTDTAALKKNSRTAHKLKPV
jgi:hypothetical protein